MYTNISIDDCKLRKRQRRSIYRLQIFSSVVSKNRKVYLTVYFYLFMYTYTQTHTYIHREVRIETGRTIISESINIASRLSLISIRWLTAVRSSALLVVIKDKKKKRPATFGRILHTSLPICGIGFYYLSGTYIAERIRGRSGPFNDLIGAYCTYPLLRKFLPLSASVAVLFFISLPLYVLARGFKINEARTSFERAASFGIQMTGYDINLMLQKKPSEPFVKRDSYNPFTIPSN